MYILGTGFRFVKEAKKIHTFTFEGTRTLSLERDITWTEGKGVKDSIEHIGELTSRPSF